MALDELTKHLGNSTSRRTIVKTGGKLAYAAPLVAASFKLSANAAGAVSPGGPCKTFQCGGELCLSSPTVCACFELLSQSCSAYWCEVPSRSTVWSSRTERLTFSCFLSFLIF